MGDFDYDAEAINLANSHSRNNDSNRAGRIINNSVGNKGAQAYTYEQKIEKVPKKSMKEAISNFLIVVTLIIGLTSIGSKVVDWGTRTYDLHKANDYMSHKIVSYLEKSDVDYALVDGSKITILEKDSEKLSNLCESLEKDGFTREESFYVVFKACGEDSLDKVVTTVGYSGASDFISDYKDPETKVPGYDVFENIVEGGGYVNKVEQIKDAEIAKIEQSKGIGL